jgi:Phosphotransferase enzyme family
MPDQAFLADWCDRYLGARPVRVLFHSGHLSEVTGAELTDGRRVVIKARPADPRIAGCIAVQEHLARAGFPCPEPLTAAVEAGGLTVTAEALVPGGSQLPADGGAAPFAALLARLVSSAPGPSEIPSLALSPPWTGWDHPGSRLWPDRDDCDRDLNRFPGPAWVDDAARRVRERLSASGAPACVGHGDWESQNIRWSGGQPGGGLQLDRLAGEIGGRLALAALDKG